MMDKLLAGLWNMLTGDVTPEQGKFLRDFGWRFLVTFHMCSAWGLLTFMGISGFTQAQETAAIKAEVSRLKDASALQTRLGIMREIRIHTTSMCAATDVTRRFEILGTIDRLREDWRQLNGETYPEVRCP
jgi:hypothetical protein